jgi:hypothetical protein
MTSPSSEVQEIRREAPTVTPRVAYATDESRSRTKNPTRRDRPRDPRAGREAWSRDSQRLDAFRALFGDERASYDDAVATHYQNGAPADWRSRFVSSYASMHPWEDWAESWAHYLHMVDALDTARSFGLALRPKTAAGDGGLVVGTRRLDGTGVAEDPLRSQGDRAGRRGSGAGGLTPEVWVHG